MGLSMDGRKHMDVGFLILAFVNIDGAAGESNILWSFREARRILHSVKITLGKK